MLPLQLRISVFTGTQHIKLKKIAGANLAHINLNFVFLQPFI